MNYNLSLEGSDNLFFMAITTVTISFLCYHFINESKKIKNKIISNSKASHYTISLSYFKRLLGFILFGIIPILLLKIEKTEPLSNFGINFNNLSLSLYFIIGLSAILILINYFNSKKADNLELYPEIRVKKWTFKVLIMSSITWIMYLWAYEFMFRGFLLFVSLKYLGLWSAIALNTAIYSLVHLPKGIKEAVGALPLGIILCFITVKTGSILAPFVIHIALALSNEWFSIKAHKDMSLMR